MSAMQSDSSDGVGTRLESWKQIAAHLNRHVTTVRRWEKQEGLPVHRHVHAALGSIYAYTTELDAWLDSRQPKELCGSPTAGGPSAVTARDGSVPPPPTLTGVTDGPIAFLGRDREIETLRQVWRAASGGQQQLVLITSEAGQGKTRLAWEFARSVVCQATVLTGLWDREALFPFAPFVSMLQWLVRACETSTLQRVFSEIEGSRELAQLAPEVAKHTPPITHEFPAMADGRRFHLFEAFAQLLVALSRDRPLLLVFEDMHWADTGSLLFLRHLIRSTRNAALCIVVTYRENEPDRCAASEEILQEFRREFTATRISLGGLGADHVRRFVELWAHGNTTPGFIDWVTETTEGNPLFVTEMLTHLDETGGFARSLSGVALAGLVLPERIRQLIRRRFTHLSPANKRLLTLGAVIGRVFRLSLLEVLTDLSEEEMLNGLEEAIAARVITETPGAPEQFSFTHALLRDTLYRDMLAARRVRWHHRIAEALERRSPPDALLSGELAYHFTEGAAYKDAEKAIEYSVRAGRQAYGGLALEESARYYGMALSTLGLLPSGPVAHEKRIELHTLCGRSWFQAGQWALAKAEFEAALRLLDAEEVVQRCELLVHLAEASFWLMDVPALRQFAGEAEWRAEAIGRDDLWADARAWRASAQVAAGDVLGGIETDRRTLARAGGIRSFGLARVPLTLYWAGHATEAAARAEEAVASARASDDAAFLLYSLQHLGICLTGVGRHDEAIKTFDEACSLGRQCGASSLLARAISMSVAPLFSLGQFASAVDRAREARELARRIAFEPPLVSAGIDLLMIFARTHDPGRAEPLLMEVEQAVAQASGWHAWKWKMRLSQARAELALARGQWRKAMSFADDVIEQSKVRNRPKYQALGLLTRARARRELGVRQMVEDARAGVEVARRLSDPVLLAECLGVLLAQEGTDELRAELRRAVDRALLGVTDPALQRSFLARVMAHGERQKSRELQIAYVRNVG